MATKVEAAPVGFRTLTLTFDDAKEFTDAFGALYAYSRGRTKCGKLLREIGLGDTYSGNARKTARALVEAMAKAAGVSMPKYPEPRRADERDAEDYMTEDETVRS